MPKGSPPAYEIALAHFGGQPRPALQITDSFIPQVGHVEAGITVDDADTSAAARLARHHERREVIPPPGGRPHLDSHAPRIGRTA